MALAGKQQSIERLTRSVTSIGIATYKEWAAYRSHMAASLLVGPVYFLVQYFIWHAVYSGRDLLNGLTLPQMIAYYGISSFIHYFIFDFADWNLQMLVRTGKFVTFALRPLPHWLYALAQKLGHRSLGFWVEFVPIGLLFLFVFHVDMIPSHPIWAIFSLVLSFMMNFIVNYMVGLTAFWLVRAEGIRRVILLLKDITAGVFVPLTFFPAVVQKVLFFLPFQFITYLPTRVIIGDYELAGIRLSAGEAVLLQAGAVTVMFGLMLLIYSAAMRRFTGVGV